MSRIKELFEKGGITFEILNFYRPFISNEYLDCVFNILGVCIRISENKMIPLQECTKKT